MAHWADLHRAEPHVPVTVRAVDREVAERVAPRPSAPLLGLEGELRLAGEGSFSVDEFSVCELAASLGLSEVAARAYVGQALELRDRLPLHWSRVMRGELPASKARRVAAETIPLNAAGAAYVDAQLAPFAHALGLNRVLRAVEAAAKRHDPHLAAERAKAGGRPARRPAPRGAGRHHPGQRGDRHSRGAGVRRRAE